ncbi:hypothetical protein F5884DRAFT_293497 [Xylogone sp. PMI_703]|nr:hypothetical protein F5884DRAFT_293497 [Xylogone sp. PMI_703]
MRNSALLSPFVALTSLLSLVPNASATRFIESSSLNTCQDNSSLTASLFNVVFTPNNNTLTFDIVGVSNIQGNVSFGIEVTAYGYTVLRENLNPCDKNLQGMCPMSTGQLDIQSNVELSDDAVNKIPGIAYTVPDLDANVKVQINSTDQPDVSLACVEANLSNGKTVDQKGVGWATAVIAGLALVASAVTSGLGHSNTAAHVAANALSLFGYLQAQAMIGLTAIHMPPIVQSWTQNFDWSMGIIKVKFMQDIATWYQKATGGTPATVLNSLTTTSVQVAKRSLGKRTVDTTIQLLTHAHQTLTKRSTGQTPVTGNYVVRGIKRVAFRAGMEATNVFMTGLSFFIVFIVFTVIAVAIFKAFCEFAVKQKWMKSEKFQDFRNGWFTVLKGIMFRMVLIGYPQMCILSLWEFTQVDSPAEVVLAVFFFFGMTGTLAWAALKVIRIAKRSVSMHHNPAYILYSDPSSLNKWGFLYVQFRATAYYFIVPTLIYTVVKGMFIAFGQNSGTTQAIGLLLIEAAALIGASVIRPWMDKSTNTFNISICAINFINAIFLLVFSDVFDQPGLVTGVMGVVFFVLNAVFSLILIILVMIATAYAFIRKNPDSRYQAMTDDRASFIKSQTQLTTELDALGATARGDKAGYKHALDLDDDNESWSSDSIRQAANQPMIGAAVTSAPGQFKEPPRSPIAPSMPLFPADNKQSAPPSYHDDRSLTSSASRGAAPSPTPYRPPNSSHSNISASRNTPSPSGYANQNASPWQRGAGYE